MKPHYNGRKRTATKKLRVDWAFSSLAIYSFEPFAIEYSARLLQLSERLEQTYWGQKAHNNVSSEFNCKITSNFTYPLWNSLGDNRVDHFRGQTFRTLKHENKVTPVTPTFGEKKKTWRKVLSVW